MKLPKFNPKARCPKCGGTKINTHHRTSNCEFSERRDCVLYDQCNRAEKCSERMERHCDRCRYEWLEAPLDVKSKK